MLSVFLFLFFFHIFLQTLYGMADLFIIGQFGGVEQTTAVSIGSQVMHMITVMIVGLSMGSTVIIARAVGAEDKKSASRTVGNTATLSQTVSVAIALAVIIKRKLISVERSDFVLRREIVLPVLKIGFPVAMQDGFIQISFILITIIANKRGLADAAAVGIVEKIMSFMFLVPSSMLSTVSALASQNIGAKKYDRANSTLCFASFIATGFGLAMAVLIQFSASSFVALFTADSVVIALGTQYLRGYIWDCFLGGIHFSFSGYFCALGKSGISFLHNLLSIVLVRVPGAYFMSKLFPENLFPMGIATACGSLLSVIVAVILRLHFFRRFCAANFLSILFQVEKRYCEREDFLSAVYLARSPPISFGRE